MTKFACVVALALAAACSKTKPADQGAGSSTTTPPPPAADAALAIDASEGSGAGSDVGSAAIGSAAAIESEFDKLSQDDKIKFMKTKVVPGMKPVFQKFDAKEYKTFGCKTCHGKDPQKRKYEMPNPDIKPLDFEAIKAGKEDPKMVEFMSEHVKPEMAKIMGMPEMSQTEPNGFGCLHCHTQKK
jgi:hypothetical protein